MSRTGKIPVEVPKDVKINLSGSELLVEGKGGKLNLRIPHGITVELKDEKVNISRVSDAKQNRANHGTIRARVVNMIKGVSQGHKRELEIQGIGFRAQLQGKKIVFNLGFSHPVEYSIPAFVKVSVPTQTSILLEGSDIVKVGQVAAKIRGLKPVEPYKGKGIRYAGEIVRRKQGKSVSK